MLKTLDRDSAQRHADAILSVDSIGWTVENLLLDLPDKWSLSFARWPGPTAYAILSRKPEGVYLHHLAVAKKLRKQGIGAEMVRECITRGVTRLKVHRENDAATRLYLRHGFVFADDGEYRTMALSRPARAGRANRL